MDYKAQHKMYIYELQLKAEHTRSNEILFDLDLKINSRIIQRKLSLFTYIMFAAHYHVLWTTRTTETMCSRMDKIAFKKTEVIWYVKQTIPYHLNFFKGYLPEVLIGPFLNKFSQLCLRFCT